MVVRKKNVNELGKFHRKSGKINCESKIKVLEGFCFSVHPQALYPNTTTSAHYQLPTSF